MNEKSDNKKVFISIEKQKNKKRIKNSFEKPREHLLQLVQQFERINANLENDKSYRQQQQQNHSSSSYEINKKVNNNNQKHISISIDDQDVHYDDNLLQEKGKHRNENDLNERENFIQDDNELCFKSAQLITEFLLILFAVCLIIIATIVVFSKKIPAIMEYYDLIPKFLFFLCIIVAIFSFFRWLISITLSRFHPIEIKKLLDKEHKSIIKISNTTKANLKTKLLLDCNNIIHDKSNKNFYEKRGKTLINMEKIDNHVKFGDSISIKDQLIESNSNDNNNLIIDNNNSSLVASDKLNRGCSKTEESDIIDGISIDSINNNLDKIKLNISTTSIYLNNSIETDEKEEKNNFLSRNNVSNCDKGMAGSSFGHNHSYPLSDRNFSNEIKSTKSNLNLEGNANTINTTINEEEL